MTMSMIRHSNDGKVSKDKISKRYQTLLNLVYLQAEKNKNGGYIIPAKIYEQIQTELDFNIPEENCKTQTIEAQIKKRYRNRSSYKFWKDFLDVSNINNYNDAKECLMSIFTKLDKTRHYGSMTHSQYALETLFLALDDTYGTDTLILNQYKFTNPKVANKKKTKAKKQTRKPQINNNVSEEDEVPF